MAERRVSGIGVMVEHHIHESQHVSAIGLMIEHHDFFINRVSSMSLGAMVEYHPAYIGSFVTSFPDIQGVGNNFLEEVVMIAGDEKEFTYIIADKDGITYDLTYADIYLTFFKHGSPYDPVFIVRANITNPLGGIATAPIADSDTVNLSGTYIQQLELYDINIKKHIISRGKVVILPSE